MHADAETLKHIISIPEQHDDLHLKVYRTLKTDQYMLMLLVQEKVYMSCTH